MKVYPEVVIKEETMREGMQIESTDILVSDKIRLLDAISDANFKRIVVGSFVSPKWVPQMKDIDEIVQGFHPKLGITYLALALNPKGLKRAMQYIPPLTVEIKPNQTRCYMCDIFAKRNTNQYQRQEIERWPAIVKAASEQGIKEATIGVNAAFGSNFTGDFLLQDVLDLLQRQWNLWNRKDIEVTSVWLGDPMGWNMPDQLETYLSAIKERWPEIHEFQLHLHNTRGMALISTYVALRFLASNDVLHLDCALGGLGGCPYCGNGRAAGLVSSEDLVYMLEEMGINTGIDLEKTIEAACLAEEVVGHPLWGKVSKSGPRPRGDKLYPPNMPAIMTFEEASHFRKGPTVYAKGLRPWKEPLESPQRAYAEWKYRRFVWGVTDE